jgi:hypothetical protein
MRGGGGFSPSAGAARPSRPSAGARPSPGGRQVAASRPSGGRAPGAPGGVRPAGPAAGGGARPGGRPPGQGVGAGQRPGAAGGVANRAAGSRPNAGQLNNFLNIPGPSTGAIGAAGVGRAGGAAADFLQGGARGPATGALGGAAANRARPDAGRPGTARENFAQNRPERIQNRGERQGNRDQRRDQIRDQYNEHNPGDFWQQNPGWAAWAITRPFAWATWGALGSWCGYGGEPTSYSYGDDVYYSEDQVYSGDQPIATADEYAEQAAELASSAPAQAPEKSDWLPLGVFALTQDGQASGSQPSLYMQMAISKEGVISGTLKNTLTGKVQPLEGMADKISQRVAWGVVDQQRPIMETGLSNLTQDASPALIHFADGQTQQEI